MPTSTRSTITEPAANAARCLTNRRANSANGERNRCACLPTRLAALAAVDSDTRTLLAIPDRRIDDGVKHVDEEVYQHELQREQQDLGLNHRIVAGVDRIDQEAPEPGPGEHRLDHNRAAEQKTELQPRHRDYRDQRIAKRMLPDHHGRAEAFSVGSAQIIVLQYLDKGRSGKAREHRRYSGTERE